MIKWVKRQGQDGRVEAENTYMKTGGFLGMNNNPSEIR